MSVWFDSKIKPPHDCGGCLVFALTLNGMNGATID